MAHSWDLDDGFCLQHGRYCSFAQDRFAVDWAMINNPDPEPSDDLPPEDSDEADELADYAEGAFTRWIYRND